MTKQKQRQRLIALYAMFFASLFLSLLPSVSAAVLCLLVGTGVLVAAYVMRARADEGSLMEGHATYVIRTIWIGALGGVVFMALGGGVLITLLDHSPLFPCAERILGLGDGLYDLDVLKTAVAPCEADYWALNKVVLILGGLIAAVPPLVYFIMRALRGVLRASKGLKIEVPKAIL